jgi:hypothetical protein
MRDGLVLLIVFRHPRAPLRFALGHTLAAACAGLSDDRKNDTQKFNILAH